MVLDNFRVALENSTALFFDLDGTISDSTELHKKAYLKVLENEGSNYVSMFKYESIKGKTTFESFLGLGFEDLKAAQLSVLKQEVYRTFLLQGELKCIPYMYDILEKLSNYRGIYLVTGSSKKTVEFTLSSLNISNFIKGFVSGDEIQISKPHPEIYETALKNFKKTRYEVVAVEDSLNGILSAISTKIFTISVDTEYQHPLCIYLEPKHFLEEINKLFR